MLVTFDEPPHAVKVSVAGGNWPVVRVETFSHSFYVANLIPLSSKQGENDPQLENELNSSCHASNNFFIRLWDFFFCYMVVPFINRISL